MRQPHPEWAEVGVKDIDYFLFNQSNTNFSQ